MSSRVSRKGRSPRTSPPRPPEASQPELQVTYTAAGHETLAAINEELLFHGKPLHSKPRASVDDGPEVSVVEGPAGRETLALITDLTRPMRSSQATLDYGDRISNAPGSQTPSRRPAARATAPAVKPTAAPAVKPTAAPAVKPIAAPAVKPTAEPAAKPPAEPAPLVIFEMLTFVVQAADAASLASDSQRRRFVETHLLERLPGKDLTLVDRIDVTPWTVQGTLVVRVWCKV